MPLPKSEITKRFIHHPPGPNRIGHHEFFRGQFHSLAGLINDLDDGGDARGSREKSAALTALEEALFWTNAHIARNIPEEDGS